MNDQREHPSSSPPLMSVSQSRKLNLCNRHVCVTDITKKGRCNGRGQLRGGRCNGGANAARSENECPCEPANRDFSACESQILARQRRCASDFSAWPACQHQDFSVGAAATLKMLNTADL